MDTKKWLDDMKNPGRKKAMPVLSFPSISLLDIDVNDLISSSDLQAKGMKAIADRVDSAASVSMMDLSVEAEAFGSEVRFSGDEVPTVVGSIISTEEEAGSLKVPEVGAGRTGKYIDAIAKAVELIDDRPVFAGVIGPFSLAGRLMDVSNTMIYCFEEPDMVHKIMKKTTQFLIDYINAYKAAGAHGVVMAEPLTGILSPAFAEEFSEPYVKQIVDAVKDENFIFIYHNCGDNTILMIDSILRTGSDAYHFGNSISMKDMMEKIPADVLGMGNIDPSNQFRNGTPESIKAETNKVMSECCVYPNFVISSGCDIPPASSWDNIDAFFDAVDEFYTA
jgi:uroporphyrinogen decarboxylase